MSRLGKFVVVVAVLWFFGATAFASHRTTLTQLLTLPLVPLFLIAVVGGLICIFTEWRTLRWRSLLPVGACILSVVSSNILTRCIRQALFAYSLPSYEQVVRRIESGEISISTNLVDIPQAVSRTRMTWNVAAQEEPDGALTVQFLTELGFPEKHSGYLYSSSGKIKPGSEADSRWPIQHEERPH